jgi:hypothetical protein
VDGHGEAEQIKASIERTSKSGTRINNAKHSHSGESQQ